MQDATACVRAAVTLAVAFLLIFAAYSATENLETSVIRGECQDCLQGDVDGICQLGNVCQNKIHFACDDACAAPFTECTSTLGSIVLGVVYLTLTFGSFFASAVPNYFGMKKSLFGSSTVYALFALANLIIAQYPTNQNLHWAIMIPMALLEGLAASVLWIAQASYLTQLSVVYSKFKHEPLVSSMGYFNGLFFSIFRASSILGNTVSSFVLGYLAWSTQTLFVMFTILGSCGSALMLILPALATASTDAELVQLVPEKSDENEADPHVVGFNFAGIWALLHDSRMLCLMPVIVINGLQQGFASGEFTSNVIRESLGGPSIGYVMALYGGVNVLSSYGFGRVADKFGPLVGMLLGFTAMLVAFSLCYGATLTKCDDQWALVLWIAVLLSLGDASSTTLTSVVLGQEFSADAVNAFSIFKAFQSGSAAASYFFFKYFSFHGRLSILLIMVLIATASFLLYSKKYRRVSNAV
ncbi:Aste57867_14035 [Aphanomyces stellatus]|uniref:Aste57867_14035 protein n=1 Tax=Aphanomyces stellatus TaxID=120398 RepID=A0A485KZN8_9STRA|nr:hypothetical protein As57867_013984 [Aphanomyces stellatus]VFT90865.1 Aste57867_14035 [Aphanomyces stellatus]